MARVAITNEEEISNLKQEVENLQEENAKLALLKQRRMCVDESLSNYLVDELKDKARQINIPMGGNKAQLMMRLVEEVVVILCQPI